MNYNKEIVSSLAGVDSWEEFEEFVKRLYTNNDGAIHVQRNYKAKGNSGRNREVDVLVKFGFTPHIISLGVECKFWAQKVDGDIIDVAAAKKDDLKLDKYAVITTVGFEAGAEIYAKSKGIDLFVIRPSVDDDFGYAGKVIKFKLSVRGSRPTNIRAKASAVFDGNDKDRLSGYVLKKLSNIELPEDESKIDPELDLYRFTEIPESNGARTYRRGDYVSNISKLIWKSWREQNETAWRERNFSMQHKILFKSPTAACIAGRVIVFINEITFGIEYVRSESEFEIDRGSQYPLVLENVIGKAITPLKSVEEDQVKEFSMCQSIAMETVDLSQKPDDVLGREGASIAVVSGRPMTPSASGSSGKTYILTPSGSSAIWQEMSEET